jgi:acetyltransferase-like isoleucine patch superfamily enzyme
MIKAIFRINKWLFYVTDIYLKLIQPTIWRLKKLSIGRTTVWLGFPIVTNFKGAFVIIGENCLICSRSEQTALGVSHKTIIRTLREKAIIQIGSNVRMSGTSISAMSSVIIGNRCVIGSDVIIADTDFHSLDPILRSSQQDSLNAISRPIVIGDDCFIGGRSIILKGVQLGDQVIVGAGSVVTKSFDRGSIIAGNPATLIKIINC